jgi:hypothetical protein
MPRPNTGDPASTKYQSKRVNLKKRWRFCWIFKASGTISGRPVEKVTQEGGNKIA